MSEIQSAFRFIPVERNQRYYSPKWRNEVSQDIPFTDEVSGSIEYVITANTPLFVKGHDGNFCKVDGHYFIPGTTMKGCIRSVLEVMSFGHLDNNRVQDDGPYSFRDIQDQEGYMRKMSTVYCGWLREDGRIVKWGNVHHVKYDDIIQKLTNCNYARYRNLNVFEKYQNVNNGYLVGNFSMPTRLPGAKSFDNRTFCQFSANGQQGTIIFSGAMQNKKSDFVLLQNNENNRELIVPSKQLNEFKQLFPSYRSIPVNNRTSGRAVFFTMENNQVTSIGLSYLHKIIAKNSVCDAVPSGMKGDNPDLADIMFGSTKYDLRGRVQFSALKEHKDVRLLLREGETFLAVLGSPCASYYPIYLQNGATWDTNDVLISGIKRYPIKPTYDISRLELHGNDRQRYIEKFGEEPNGLKEANLNGRKLIPRDATNGEINFDTISKLKPLKENSSFKGMIRFHNLKEEELGALLSALTFYGQQDKCKHSLGQAKAYGYGSVSVSDVKLNINNTNDCKYYMNKFSQLMDSVMNTEVGINRKWKETPQIKELFAMATGFSDSQLRDLFTPMLLEQFGKMKGRDFRTGEYKNQFSSYIGVVGSDKTATQKSTNKEVSQKEEIAVAKVTVFQGQTKQAKLIEGKNSDQSRPLKIEKVKLVVGDKIKVKVIRKGGNIQEFQFIAKV